MEDLVMSLAEKTIVGACFIYLLYHVVQNLKDVSVTLTGIKDALVSLNVRVEALEKKIGM